MKKLLDQSRLLGIVTLDLALRVVVALPSRHLFAGHTEPLAVLKVDDDV